VRLGRGVKENVHPSCCSTVMHAVTLTLITLTIEASTFACDEKPVSHTHHAATMDNKKLIRR